MDKSLDELIASKPKGGARRGTGRRSTGRIQILGKPTVGPNTRSRAVAPVVATNIPTSQPSLADKIVVSNLPIDVSEAQVKELFATTVGPLREVTLHYDSHGKSKGVATVVFNRKGDGNKAYTQYNNRLIDGKRPMKIEIVVDPIRAAPLASRVAPAAVAAPVVGAPRNGGPVRRRRGGGGGGRGGAGAPGGPGGKRGERPQKSAADLDAEMEDYTAAASGPAAPATA